jgi:hypothetical protein
LPDSETTLAEGVKLNAAALLRNPWLSPMTRWVTGDRQGAAATGQQVT